MPEKTSILFLRNRWRTPSVRSLTTLSLRASIAERSRVRPSKRDPVLLESLLGEVIKLARIEHGLAGDAAHVQARSTQGRALLDACDLHAELRCPDGRDVTTGAGPDDHQVEL